ncbi:MAG: GTPase ObgE [Candidatus Latescibacteria bacterium]|nr:GTPase ObgE [Candidatus Latescibacterota bacterium]
MFIDTVNIYVTAGTGGSGCASFRRERGVPRGGPDGGNGGKGGDVMIEVDAHMRTLLDFKRKPHVKAGRGSHGRGSNKTGADGDDATIRVPPGTVVYDEGTGEMLADLIETGQSVVAAGGGRGGRGNARFATSVNQAPRQWEAGGPGEEKTLRLELKLIADVGLVGLPNAGKSTLLSRVSEARPKIADYPFTTLAPNLGLVGLGEWESCVMADIPGLIEGASEGKGLGTDFLRHIERTRVLLYLDDIFGDNPLEDVSILKKELSSYSPLLIERPAGLLLTKLDLVPPEDRSVHLELRGLPVHVLPQERATGTLPDVIGMPCTAVSSQTGEGLETVLHLIKLLLKGESET